MKKITKTLLVALLGTMSITACDVNNNSTSTSSNNSTSSVLTGDALILDELLARVTIPQNNTEVINNFTLPATVKYGEYVGDITWTSDSGYLVVDSKKTTIEDAASGTTYDVYNAVVVRPENGEGDATVRLTATVAYNGLTGNKTQKVTITEKTGATENRWGTFSAPLESLKISTWEEWRAQESGKIAVQGIITGMIYQSTYSNANVFLQDEDGGYYAYAVGEMSKTEAENYLAVGNEVIFEGEKSIYNGLHEFNQEKVTGIEVLSRGHETQPTDVTEAATTGDLNRYQAMYVKATGLLVTSEGKNYLQFGENKYEIYHNEKYSGSYYKTVTEQLETLKVGDTVDVTGMIGCYNADQFHPYNMVKSSTQIELTDEEKLEIATSGVESTLYEYEDTTLKSATEISLYSSTDENVTITYTLNDGVDTEVFNLSTDKLTITPTEEEKTATLTVKIAVGSLEETVTYTLKAQLPSGDELKYVINKEIPSGLTYIPNSPDYPNPSFYGDGGLKLNYENMGVMTGKFAAQKELTVSFNISAMYQNTKTASGTDIFTIIGLDDNGTEVAKVTYNDVIVGDNNVKLSDDSEIITQVKIMYTSFYNDGTKCCNLSLSGVTLFFGENTGGTGTPDTPNTDNESSIANVYAAEDGANVVVTGIVSSIKEEWSTTHNNMSVYIIDDSSKELYVYRLATQVEVGDEIKVTGTVGSYSGTKQIVAGATAEILSSDNEIPSPLEMTIAEALKAGLGTKVVVTGIVSSIKEEWSSYNNMSVYITDETFNTLYLYRISTQVEVGDEVKVTGLITAYGGTNQIAAGGTAEILSSDNEVPVAPEEPKVEGVYSYTFSDYEKGTQYAKNEEHILDENTTVTTTDSHFTTELRIYSSSTNDGFAIIKSEKVITKFEFNAGYKNDTLNVYGSVDGKTYTLIEGVVVTSTYSDYTVEIEDSEYKYLKLDVAGENQIRVKSFTITTA